MSRKKIYEERQKKMIGQRYYISLLSCILLYVHIVQISPISCSGIINVQSMFEAKSYSNAVTLPRCNLYATANYQFQNTKCALVCLQHDWCIYFAQCPPGQTECQCIFCMAHYYHFSDLEGQYIKTNTSSISYTIIDIFVKITNLPYIYADTLVSKATAENFCSNLGRKLLHFSDSQTDFKTIATIFDSLPSLHQSIWTSGYKTQSGEWKWSVDDEVIPQWAWNPGEPSGRGECAAFYLEANSRRFKLNDDFCNMDRGIIVCMI